MILRAKNCNFFKCQKSILFEGVSSWFFSKTPNFSSQFFFFRNYARKTIFNILDRELFLNKKIEVLKSAKNQHVLRG